MRQLPTTPDTLTHKTYSAHHQCQLIIAPPAENVPVLPSYEHQDIRLPHPVQPGEQRVYISPDVYCSRDSHSCAGSPAQSNGIPTPALIHNTRHWVNKYAESGAQQYIPQIYIIRNQY